MYRIAIFADLHANLPALQSVLKHIEKISADEIISLGDNIDIGPHPSQCIDLIMKYNIKSVLGNHEEYFIKGSSIQRPPNISDGEYEHQLWTQSLLNQDHRNYLSTLPYIIEEKIGSLSISVMHSPFRKNTEFTEFNNLRNSNPMEIEAAFSHYDNNIICFGHSHLFLDLSLVRRYINPGSVGCHKDAYAQFSILEMENDLLNVSHHQVSYDRSQVIDDLYRLNVPDRDLISKIFFQCS